MFVPRQKSIILNSFHISRQVSRNNCAMRKSKRKSKICAKNQTFIFIIFFRKKVARKRFIFYRYAVCSLVCHLSSNFPTIFSFLMEPQGYWKTLMVPIFYCRVIQLSTFSAWLLGTLSKNGPSFLLQDSILRSFCERP